MDKKDTRAAIISRGAELIARHGYNATGIDAVLKLAGVPKGSFYHYFASKEEFGLAVLDHVAHRYLRRLSSHLDDESLPPLQRIRTYLESGLVRLTQNQCATGCLIGNLGQELADQNERFRARLEEVFRLWNNQLADCLQQAQQQGALAGQLDPSVLAGFILSGWEGAILRAKVMRSPAPLQDFIATLFATLLRP